MDRTERTALLITLLSIPLVLVAAYKLRENYPSTSTTRPTRTTSFSVARPSVATTTTTTTAPAVQAASIEAATTTTTSTSTTTTTPTQKIARGVSHSCSWTHLGGVWCWGSNHRGELGTGFYPSSRPLRVEGLPRDIHKVVAADHTTCAQGDADGTHVAYCWGYRLGGGSDIDPVDAWAPAQVNLPNVTDIAVGTSGQVCAVSTGATSSRIYCWGDGWSHDGVGGFDGGHFTSKPVLVGEYRHVHELEVGYREARAHVGFNDGGCGWIEWGEGRGYGTVVRVG